MTVIHVIKPETLSKWLESDEVLLIDVREPAEYNAESINKARNIPLSQVTIDDAYLLEHRDKKLVIHCQSGKRSMMACEKLKADSAPYDIWNLEGGINAWKEAGLHVVSFGKKILPIDQQVQLSIGFIIAVGIILGYALSSYWLLLPLIVSFGLINAGITGWCGLAKFIAKMPWNKR